MLLWNILCNELTAKLKVCQLDYSKSHHFLLLSSVNTSDVPGNYIDSGYFFESHSYNIFTLGELRWDDSIQSAMLTVKSFVQSIYNWTLQPHANYGSFDEGKTIFHTRR